MAIGSTTSITGPVKVELPNRLVLEAINEFNKLRAYPLDKKEIVEWASTLERVVIDLDPLMLCWLVDEMLAGRHEYDKHGGIQNLTLGLMKIEKTKTGYKFKTDFPG